ncbi:LysR substrate-binding domain-containing protein [Schlegelella sp. S2-27]|uniref:LysR substrate-binding domain-containing protein n=1 Tax=Caldimonas mangrovi TaxID=2944811 RepID=A0ABT0YPV6_9BURK|nr:LysR substrate-binding domain-containing protein [Caldimonas mangrovi]
MRIRSPSLPELHAFAALAKTGSFSLAAESLCVTQGAVSRAIARLEAHLGQTLVTRRGRRSELTPVGQTYLQSVAGALEQLESSAQALQTNGRRRALRLSVTPSLFSKWLIPRLPDFHALHPEVALSFVPYRRDDPLDAAEADAWIRSGDGRWPRGIRSDYLVGRELVPICSPGDVRPASPPLDAQGLLSRPLLFHVHYPDNWRRWFEAQGCGDAQPQPAAHFDQVSMLVQAVIAGLGCAVVQRCLIEEELASGRVAIACGRSVEIERGYHLCYPAAQRDAPALAAWREWLLEQAGRH